MKKIILLIAIFISASLTAQVGQARILKVKDGQMDKFVSSVSKKTKMFNDSEGSDKYFTFRILTGPNQKFSLQRLLTMNGPNRCKGFGGIVM